MNIRKASITVIVFALCAFLLHKCGKSPETPSIPGPGAVTPSNPNPSAKPKPKPPKIVIGEPKKPPVNSIDPPDWKPGTPFPGFPGENEIDNNIYLILQPGLGFMYTNRARISLDLQLVRWRSFGLNGGVGLAFVNANRTIDSEWWGGISYRLFARKDDDGIEPSLFLAYTFKNRVGGGIRIRF